MFQILYLPNGPDAPTLICLHSSLMSFQIEKCVGFETTMMGKIVPLVIMPMRHVLLGATCFFLVFLARYSELFLISF